MLLFKQPGRTFKWPHIILALGLSVFLGACGFSPLYGKKGTANLTAEQNLALIDIKLISDRKGQQFRNNLLDRLNPKGRVARPLYSLSVTLSESIGSLGVKKSAMVTRGNLTISASYSLTNLHPDSTDAKQTNTSLASGTVLAKSSYDIPQAQYTSIAAVKDARTRALKEVADDLKTRLAVYFQQSAN
jgi:LPS-assembly lipoprotein